MAGDPFRWLQDAPLFIVPSVLERLRAYREGLHPAGAQEEELERLAGRLLDGIEAHPTRFWVLKQFQRSLEAVRGEDAGAGRRFVEELARLGAIVGVEGVEGLGVVDRGGR